MSLPLPAPVATSPDREFSRAIGLVLAAALALALGGYAALDAVGERQHRAAQMALVTSEQTVALRQVAGGFARLASPGRGIDPVSERAALGWALERLIELETRRAALAGEGPEAAPSRLASAASATLAALPDGFEVADARTQRDLYAARLLPATERTARSADIAATESRAAAQRSLVLLLVLHLALGGLLVAMVVSPARRRIRDWVTRTEAAEQDTRHRLLHDPLTHLPNATYLQAHLERIAAGAERAKTQTAVLRIDLDRFKVLRDTLGPRVAAEIIRIAARRIRSAQRAGDFVAYLGQDDFVLVASELEDGAAAAAIAHRVQQALCKPFALQGGARRIDCSIGVTMLSDDEPEADRVRANAEIALAEAQGAGPGNVRYFRESLRTEAEQREILFAELLGGLERGELMPFFQPQIDIATGAFAGFEALVRWMHPRRGLLTPAAFLDFAEAADLTERIGEVVLDRSLQALLDWDAAGFHVPKVGVNFALAQLRDPRLIEKIKWEVERQDIDPGRLAIEVLETVLIKSDTDLVVRNLRGLASAGFEIELDDFGTGHASIQNLRRFMVNRIKIDRSFIFGIESSEEQQTLTASMIAMARALGIRTLAEGVETAEAEAVLRDLGCDQLQGYLIAKPMSFADTFGWLETHSRRERGGTCAEAASGGDPNIP